MANEKPKKHDLDHRNETIDLFHEVVNMEPAEIEKWLETDESKKVGFKEEEGAESVGHQSGRRIVELLRTRASNLTASDIDHMRKVVGYVHRHAAQKPKGDISETRWRYSLMNWGHDPMKA